jgi:hypothetical protein
MRCVVTLILGLLGSLVLIFVIYLIADRIDKATHKNIRLLEADLLSNDEEERAKAQGMMIRLKKDNVIASTVANNCVYLLILVGAAFILAIFLLWVVFFASALLPPI